MAGVGHEGSGGAGGACGWGGRRGGRGELGTPAVRSGGELTIERDICYGERLGKGSLRVGDQEGGGPLEGGSSGGRSRRGLGGKLGMPVGSGARAWGLGRAGARARGGSGAASSAARARCAGRGPRSWERGVGGRAVGSDGRFSSLEEGMG